MDISQQSVEDFTQPKLEMAVVEKQIRGLSPSTLAIDPQFLPGLETDRPEIAEFLQYLSREVREMSRASGAPYRESTGPRDLSQYKEMVDLYRSEGKGDAVLAATKINKLYPGFWGKELLKSFIYVMEEKSTDAEYYDTSMLSQLLWKFSQCSLTWNGREYASEIKALTLYAFAHFIVPIDDHPPVISQVKDNTVKEAIFSKLSALCNNPANTGDVRGAYLLLTMYAVLNLDMPFKSRMDQIRDFFFFHLQPKQNEKVKENLLHVLFLLAVSDPNRYGRLDEGQAIVKHAQCVLLVSCPYISESLTVVWSQLMQTLIDAYRSKKLKDFDLAWMKKEAQALIAPSDPNIPCCRPSALPILQQIVTL